VGPALPLILLVEDDDGHAELIRRAFEDRGGARLEIVGDLASAAQALTSSAGAPDLIITDLRLPDGAGTDLLGGMSADRVPALVVITSQGDEAAAVDAMKSGALDYVVKTPESLRNMPRLAERALRERRLLDDKRRLQLQLVERERLAAIGTTSAMLAHEINNPLTNMRLVIDLLQRRTVRGGASDAEVAEALGIVMSQIKRLSGLLTEFADLANPPSLSLLDVGLERFLGAQARAHRVFAEASGVELTVDVQSGVPSVSIDLAKMTQVMLNLIKNAIEAMPGGGQLTLGARADGDAVAILIADNGPGLPDGVDLFTPFTTTKSGGSGLGLAIVRQIVTAHGGTIEAENGPDGGARFTITLPAAPSA